MKVGFIGIGSMGRLLVESFISSGALEPQQISVSNRTFSKAESIAERHAGLHACATNSEAAAGKDVVFLCVKPLEYKPVIDELRHTLAPDQIVVSITSPVMLSQLEDWLPCKIAKVIPSITNLLCCGATLCMYGRGMDDSDKTRLTELLSFISSPLVIDERHTRIVSDLSSCGPAFMAFLLQQFIDAAVAETGIPRRDAAAVACNMLYGTGRLLTEGGMTPEQLQARVAVPGGITAKALALLGSESDGLFNAVIRATHAKYDEDLERVTLSLYGKEVKGS